MSILNRIINTVIGGILRYCSNSGLAQVEGYVDDDLHDDVRMYQHYGFSSIPPAGANVAMVSLGGRSDRAVTVAERHDDHRLAMSPGDVALHGLSSGGDMAFIRIAADGSITIDAQLLKTINIGDGATQFMVLGTTMAAHMATFASSVAAATTPAQIAAAGAALASSMAGGAAWLSTTARVK